MIVHVIIQLLNNFNLNFYLWFHTTDTLNNITACVYCEYEVGEATLHGSRYKNEMKKKKENNKICSKRVKILPFSIKAREIFFFHIFYIETILFWKLFYSLEWYATIIWDKI